MSAKTIEVKAKNELLTTAMLYESCNISVEVLQNSCNINVEVLQKSYKIGTYILQKEPCKIRVVLGLTEMRLTNTLSLGLVCDVSIVTGAGE